MARVAVAFEANEMTTTDIRKGLENAMTAAANKAAADYRAAHPEASRMQASVKVNAYRQRPRGYSQWPVKLTELFIRTPATAAKSNAELIAWLSERYDGYAIPEAAFYKLLSASQRRVIDKALSDAGMPGRTKPKDTFSTIKQRWQALRGRAEGLRSATVEVVFAEECVVVGDKRYTIEAGRYPAIRVGKNRLRSDILELLLIGTD